MKKGIALLWIALVCVFCTACGAEKISNEKPETSQSFVEEAEGEELSDNEELVDDAESEDDQKTTANSYPATIIDQAGREVVLEKQPESIVSVYYITTSALLALDLKDEIKGIESNPEKRAIYRLCAPELLEVTKVGSPKELDFEVCASLQPDLIILPLRAKDMVEPLEKLGLTVMVVNPESQEDIFEMLALIGEACGRVERAAELTTYIQDKIDFLEEKLAKEESPSVYLGGNSSFFSTASGGMYQNDLLSLAGGKNVAGEIDDTYWVEVSYEQILEWNPQAIVLASESNYELSEIQNDPKLADCQAVVNERIYQIPSDVEAWDSPVPSSFLGAAYIASVLHPEAVPSSQYEDMVEEFYEKFYGFSYAEK